MTRDWDAVASAIQARMAELEMTQAELAQKAGVALMTIRELQHNLRPRRRSPRTMAAVSEALGWYQHHLLDVLMGEQMRETDPLTEVLRRLDAIEARLDVLERDRE